MTLAIDGPQTTNTQTKSKLTLSTLLPVVGILWAGRMGGIIMRSASGLVYYKKVNTEHLLQHTRMHYICIEATTVFPCWLYININCQWAVQHQTSKHIHLIEWKNNVREILKCQPIRTRTQNQKKTGKHGTKEYGGRCTPAEMYVLYGQRCWILSKPTVKRSQLPKNTQEKRVITSTTFYALFTTNSYLRLLERVRSRNFLPSKW